MSTYFQRSASQFNPEDIPDLTGKVAIVTGGNSGAGYHVAQHLAQKGCTVWIAARDEQKSYRAIARMKRTGGLGTGSVDWLKLDLSTPRKAQQSANLFLTNNYRLDILVNNAGVIGESYNRVIEGGLSISHTFSTNHLGHFVFVQTLLPILKRTARPPRRGGPAPDVRIITIASESHRLIFSRPDLGSIEGWNAFQGNFIFTRLQRAALSKLSNLLFAQELQRRLDKDGIDIVSIALHPGHFTSDGLMKSLKISLPPIPFVGFLIIGLLRFGVVFLSFATSLIIALSAISIKGKFSTGASPFFMTPKIGSYTTLFAATSPTIRIHKDTYKGSYILPFDRKGTPSAVAQDEELARELWEFSEKITDMCINERPPVKRAPVPLKKPTVLPPVAEDASAKDSPYSPTQA